MPLQVFNRRHLEVHVHLNRHVFGRPSRWDSVCLLLNGQDSVPVFIEKDQSVGFIRTAVCRRRFSLPVTKTEELPIELAQLSAVSGVDSRVKQDRKL
jgi:hypothetical protein